MPDSNFIRFDLSLQPITTQKVMRKAILIALTGVIMGSAPSDIYAGNVNRTEKSQKAGKSPSEKKTGWGFGILPCLTFSSDMGFQYGIFGDLYNYGDGSTYPNYRDKISYEASHFTKGRTRLFLSYDSRVLIPKVRSSVSFTYIDDPLYSFWGFNGAATPVFNSLISNKSYASQISDGTIPAADAAFFGTMGVDPLKKVSYYYTDRDIIRVLADFQGNITAHLQWAGGLSYWNFRMKDINEKKYGYDAASTLYNHYKQFGVIKESEAKGGSRLEIKAGLVYDSRDFETAPNKGLWAELYVNGSPDVFGDGFNYLKLNAHFRHYVSIPFGFKVGDPVFAYHLAYQGNLAGETPFYMQQNISALVLKQMMSEGLGSSNTIRGTHANRLIGDGYLWGNFELRIKFVDFRLLKQNFYIAANPFFDCGMIVQPYRVREMSALPEIQALAVAAGHKPENTQKYIRNMASQFISTGGFGLKLAWNQNFIASAEIAHNFNKGIGDPFWISLGTNYCF